MKCVFIFLFILFFGFFDVMLLFISGLFLVFYFLFDLSGGWFGGLGFCDSVSFFLIYLTLMVFYFCVLSSSLDMWGKESFWGFSFLLLSIFFLLVLSFIFFSVFLFYICFEAIFMFMFFFVMNWGYSPERVQASFYMVFYTIVVSLPFLMYIVMFESEVFTLKFASFCSFSSYWWVFMVLVFLVKLPVYGVHLWLPKAHVEAPVSGSMVLAGVLLKLGGYGFLRLSKFFFYMPSYSGYLISVGLLGGLCSCFICLRQVDLKSFVAYSSICHMGFGLGGIYTGSWLGLEGGVFMLIAHGFCSSCLFFVLYVVYERFHSRSVLILKGLGIVVPVLLFFWFTFSALNMGVPPSFSFFSEIFIVSGVSMLSFYSVFLSGLFLFFAGVYGIFLYVVSCHGVAFMGGVSYSMFVREYLNFFGHLFPLVSVPLVMGVFYA